MMKFSATLVVLFWTVLAGAQKMKRLEEVNGNGSLENEKSVIYGNFIQRLGFSSGGFPQDIRLLNIDTQKILTFTVKPLFKTAKENEFFFYIEPGNYAILNYWWTQSKWYGGKMFTEPVFKNVDATDHFKEKIASGTLITEKLQLFTFTITAHSLNYMGTWHFDTGLVSFTNDKQALDKEVSGKYKKLDFTTALTVIPD